MDLDKALVSAILTEGRSALERAMAKGITADRLQGDGREAYKFVLEYFQRFGTMPIIAQLEGKTGIDLNGEAFFLEDVPERSTDWFVDEVNNRHLHTKLQLGLKDVVALQSERKPTEAFGRLEKVLIDLRQEQIGSAPVQTLFSLNPELKAFYDKIKAGARGIQTRWPTINDLTLGFWPEDLILFAARVGTGKSWTAVLLALDAWWSAEAQQRTGKRVLFITTEMSKIRIGMRFIALKERLPYGDFTHGRLTFLTEERFYRAMDELYNEDGLFIIGGDFDFHMDSVAAAIESCKPDLVVVDGVYLIRVAGNTRTERMANVFDEMKRLAKRKRLPVVITTQLNREAKKDNAGKDSGAKANIGVEHIALSDVGGWNADIIFALMQSADMKNDRRMLWKPLKAREGEGRDFTTNWDLERMDFTELQVATGGGRGDADEEGLVTPSDDDIADVEVPF